MQLLQRAELHQCVSADNKVLCAGKKEKKMEKKWLVPLYNQIKGPELFQQSSHRLQWQPRNKEDSSVLLIKNINTGMTVSDLFIFHQSCSCWNCWKCTQLLYRNIVWLGCLCETIYPKYCITIWKKRHWKVDRRIKYSSHLHSQR